MFACLRRAEGLEEAVLLFQNWAKPTPGVVDLKQVDCALGRKGQASGLGSQRLGFGMSVTLVGVALKDSLLSEQKGAVVTSCGMASLGAGGKCSLFWQYAQSPIWGEGGKITIVCCPCGGRTNSVLVLHRTAPSALARRTGHRP